MIITYILGSLVFSLISYIVIKAYMVNKYWKQRGLKSLKPIPFFGNTLPVFLKKKHASEIYTELCSAYPNEPLLGFYDLMAPRLIVQDPELIERILVKDFRHFTDHSFASPNEDQNPVDHYQLFNLRGEKWKAYRYKMSPAFSSGKLKYFYSFLDICSNKMTKHIENNLGKDLVLKTVIHEFVSDFVRIAIFGFDPVLSEKHDAEFLKMGKGIFDISYLQNLLWISCPMLGEKLGLKINPQERVNYFINLIQEAFTLRRESGQKKNDFIQMLIQLKDEGKVSSKKDFNFGSENNENIDQSLPDIELTDVGLMSQAFTFLTTGLDTVPVVLEYCFYDLAKNAHIQERLRKEIIEQTELHSGLTYDALHKMTNLENAIKESLRLHPIILGILRRCSEDYTFPNGYRMKEGEVLHIPIKDVQLNPNNHYEPLKFIPERFEKPIKPGTYFPFGQGPRICIAWRFAMLQLKYVLAKILTDYNVSICPLPENFIKIKPLSLVVEAQEPLKFRLTKIKLHSDFTDTAADVN